MTEEVWKVIDGHPDYEISNHGRLWSWKSHVYVQGKYDKDGYIEFGMKHVSGKMKYYRIHRLVALAFIPNPDNKPVVDHIDGDVKNNHVNNLRWATVSENTFHSRKHKPSVTGVKGITFKNNKYRVRMQCKDKYLSLGSYYTLEEAIEVRLKKARELYGEFVHSDEGKVINVR